SGGLYTACPLFGRPQVSKYVGAELVRSLCCCHPFGNPLTGPNGFIHGDEHAAGRNLVSEHLCPHWLRRKHNGVCEDHRLNNPKEVVSFVHRGLLSARDSFLAESRCRWM